MTVPVQLALNPDRLAILSDLAARQHQDIDTVVNALLGEVLDDYQETQHLKAIIKERDTARSEFVPYDAKIWD